MCSLRRATSRFQRCREELERQESTHYRVHATDEAGEREVHGVHAHGRSDGVLLRRSAQHQRLGHRADAEGRAGDDGCARFFYGTPKVGATFENGYLTGIYEMEGEKMGEVKG